MVLELASEPRCKHEIKREILSLLSGEGAQKSIDVMYKARISYVQLVAYKNRLLCDGAVTVTKEEDTRIILWDITPAGRELLKKLRGVCA